jgi:hypothetical protein
MDKTIIRARTPSLLQASDKVKEIPKTNVFRPPQYDTNYFYYTKVNTDYYEQNKSQG